MPDKHQLSDLKLKNSVFYEYQNNNNWGPQNSQTRINSKENT